MIRNIIDAVDCIIGAVGCYLDGCYDIDGIRGLARDIVAEIAAI
jgi:hypothetical protein